MAEIKNLFLGIILFTLIIVGGVTLMNLFKLKDYANAEEQAKMDAFNHTFVKMDELSGSVNDLSSTLKGQDDKSFLGVLNSLINTIWTALSAIPTSINFFITMMSDTTAIFVDIPSWAISLGVLAILIVIAFSMFSAVFQRDL